jgi:hypothetical protein
VIHWGFDAQDQLSPPVTLGDALAISATYKHALALRCDLSVVAWGQRDCCSGATSVPVGLRNVFSVAAGSSHNLALIHPLPPSPRAAAIAQVVNGFLVGVTVTATGFGYTSPPAVQVTGGGGTGAVLVPVMDNGRVVRVTVENPSRDYTSTPQIIIAAPPLPPPSLSVAVSRVVVRQQVNPGVTYRLESSPDLQAWSPVGDPFVAESELEQREINVTDGALHFRLVEMP